MSVFAPTPETTATVTLLETRRFTDARGWFVETYSERWLASFSIHDRFVQDNHSCSAKALTLRGIHFQPPPRAQAKLVRCLRGSVIDCAVDLRRGSPTYGCSALATLSADNGRQMFIPKGFGHGFLTLEDYTEVAYKVSDIYAPEAEMGVVWNDPDLAINWSMADLEPILSGRDLALPTLAELHSPFVYDGIPMTTAGQLD